jgi:pseudo-rSAM protein
LDKLKVQKNYYLYFKELADFAVLNDIFLNRDKTNLIIQFDSYLDKSFLLNLTTHLSQFKERLSFDIAISSEQELHHNESILSYLNGFDYSYKPYYTGSNTDFFKKHVFIKEEDILSEIITQSEIIKSTSINRFYWGGLTILSDGTVYSNMNDDQLGNIFDNSIKELIHNELKRDNGWRIVRKTVSPCKNCIYSALCPPISNYEFIFKKFDLCNVN